MTAIGYVPATPEVAPMEVVKVSLSSPVAPDAIPTALIRDRSGRVSMRFCATGPLYSRMAGQTERFFLADIGREGVELTDLLPDQGW